MYLVSKCMNLRRVHTFIARAKDTVKLDLSQTRCGHSGSERVKNKRPALFRGRHFQDEIIVLCVRWYLRYSLSYRDLDEMMAKRELGLDFLTRRG
jgi:hypothetical protein